VSTSPGPIVADVDFTPPFAFFVHSLGADAPWGWQLMGHHMDLHCVFVGGQTMLAPAFLGAEPTVGSGRFAGVRIFHDETEVALTLRRILAPDREDKFLMGPSLRAADLPPELAGPWNGRHLAGAGSDNLVLRPDRIVAAGLSPDQQDRLIELIRVYLGRIRPEQAEPTLALVREHLEQTRFA